MKMTLHNNVTNRTGAVYAENYSKLSWPIRHGAIYDENDIRQQCDWSYRCGLHQKWYWIVVIDRISVAYIENETEL